MIPSGSRSAPGAKAPFFVAPNGAAEAAPLQSKSRTRVPTHLEQPLSARPRACLQGEALGVPERLRGKDSGISPFDRAGDGGERILIDQVNKWRLLGGDFLHAIETLFALLRIRGGRLRTHQPVNLGFPGGFRGFLLRVPRVIFGRT